jgi:hypothetical protein
MANFALSLINPITTLPDITVAANVMSIVDHSNYGDGTEAGHARVNFASFYKVKIVTPSGSVYWFSSLGDGDAAVVAPSAGNPTVEYSYSTGDGQYWVTVYALPNYSAGANYQVANTPHVWYGDKVWKCLRNTIGNAPVAGLDWEEVPSIDSLPAKYRVAQRVVVYADAKRTYARRIFNANTVNNRIGENWEKLLRDPEYIDAVRLFIAINSIPVSMAAANWTAVDTSINFTKQIASKYEV